MMVDGKEPVNQGRRRHRRLCSFQKRMKKKNSIERTQ